MTPFRASRGGKGLVLLDDCVVMAECKDWKGTDGHAPDGWIGLVMDTSLWKHTVRTERRMGLIITHVRNGVFAWSSWSSSCSTRGENWARF